jgi:hypothetical protein
MYINTLPVVSSIFFEFILNLSHFVHQESQGSVVPMDEQFSLYGGEGSVDKKSKAIG